MSRTALQSELFPLCSAAPYSVTYEAGQESIVRVVEGRNRYTSAVPAAQAGAADGSSYDWHWLRLSRWPAVTAPRGKLAVADLFCGSGGLSLGAWEAARAIQRTFRSVLAVDDDQDALDVYAKNFSPTHCLATPIESLVDGTLGTRSTERERILSRWLEPVDLLLAGPPCQGHSDLNNHTRRDDPRNSLILRVVRFAELFLPRHILVENVQGVRHDRSRSFQTAEGELARLGYATTSFLMEGSEIGVPQRRRRCFLLASRMNSPALARLQRAISCEERSLDWACHDLELASSEDVFNSSASVFPQNQRRMEYLLEHDLYDLPDSERPDCHRLKDHDYRAVYGRLRPDLPAPTITTGFGSPGQGRFTHPRVARTLTPHEAARLQFIPDFFSFPLQKRKKLQKLIGNAVPPKMAFAAVLEMIVDD